ncbi:unnamed protein product [Urochloa humidicola]
MYVQVTRLRPKKGSQLMRVHQEKLLIHCCNSNFREGFALWMTKPNSPLKINLHLPRANQHQIFEDGGSSIICVIQSDRKQEISYTTLRFRTSLKSCSGL